MKQTYPIAVVHCRDQTFASGAYDPRTEEFELSEMFIAGHLLRQDERKVVLALEHFNDHDVRYVSSIPRETIIKMEILREA